MKKHTRKMIALGSAAAVSLVMAMPALAATPTPQKTREPHGLIGTVESINGSTIALAARNGTTYSVDAAAAVVKKGVGKYSAPITLGDIAVGDKVAVRGTLSGTTETATKIVDGIPAHVTAHRVFSKNIAFGTVTTVTDGTITVEQKTQEATTTLTVATNSATTYKRNGVADTLADITVGSRIVARGTKDANGNITSATSVNIMVAHAKKSSK